MESRYADRRNVDGQAVINIRDLNDNTAGVTSGQEATRTSNSTPLLDKGGTSQHINRTSELEPGNKQELDGTGVRNSLENPDTNNSGLAIQEGDEFTTSKLILRFLQASKLTFLALVIYSLTIYCAVTAADRRSPLGLVSPSHGILILNILSKAGDISLAAAAGSVWCHIQWKLISGKSAPSLATVFALGSWTDVLGLLRISRRSKGNGNDSPRFWSIARLIAICCLPGPGIFIMSDVNVVNLNFPVGWTSISGGMGVFDPQLVDVFKEGSGPYISRLVQTILRDPAISFEMTPINSACTNSSLSCTSYLLPGGVESVSPWPFNITATDESNYIVQAGPAYQIDFGDISGDVSWNQSNCHVYGSNQNALQLCIQSGTDLGESGQLISGWRVCPENLTAAGECDQPGSWDASELWTTSMIIYRRTATVSASRIDWSILDVEDLSQPTLETINPIDLFTAFDAILVFATDDASTDQCSVNTPEYQLTKYLYIYLNQSTTPIAQISSVPLDYLRNLLATPLFLCNPVMLTSANSPTSIQPGLPQENYLSGSYAVSEQRAVPGRWTVWTYIGTGGMILLIIFAALAWASLTVQPEDSSFPVADLLISATIMKNCQEDGDGKMQASKVLFDEIFADIEPGKNSEIVGKADRVTVKLKTEKTDRVPVKLHNQSK